MECMGSGKGKTRRARNVFSRRVRPTVRSAARAVDDYLLDNDAGVMYVHGRRATEEERRAWLVRHSQYGRETGGKPEGKPVFDLLAAADAVRIASTVSAGARGDSPNYSKPYDENGVAQNYLGDARNSDLADDWAIFMSNRDMFSDGSWVGASSDSLVARVNKELGIDDDYRGFDFGRAWVLSLGPSDYADLDRCEQTYRLMPEAMKVIALPILEDWRWEVSELYGSRKHNVRPLSDRVAEVFQVTP